MDKKIRLLNSEDIVNLEKAGYTQIEPQKRQVRDPILSATDIANINILVDTVIILSKFHLGEQVSNEDIATLIENLSAIKEYKEKLKALDIEAISNIPNDIKYYM